MLFLLQSDAYTHVPTYTRPYLEPRIKNTSIKLNATNNYWAATVCQEILYVLRVRTSMNKTT